MGRHGGFRSLQDADDFVHAETIKELAHPDGIRTVFALGEGRIGVEQVNAISVDALCTLFAFDVFLHHGYLLRQVENGDVCFFAVTDALQGPLASVATDIVERADMVVVENDFQCLRK